MSGKTLEEFVKEWLMNQSIPVKFNHYSFAQAVAAFTEKRVLEECVCQGNFRQIVKESQDLLGIQFKDSAGQIFSFFGIVWGDDDFYYGMSGVDGMRLLSCVGNLETHGFEPIDRRLAALKGEKDG